jgi:hypothetical protein
VNRVYGAALVGLIAGVVVASAIGSVTRRRPHTVLGALAGALIAGAGEAVYLIVIALWPLLVAIAVLIVAGLAAVAAQTFRPARVGWRTDIPEDWEGPED